MKTNRINPALLGAVWGFAEATLWFIVPDLPLTFLVFKSTRIALRAAIWATLGALLGGTLMYVWGNSAADVARHWVSGVPGISMSMIEEVRDELASDGNRALFRGPLNGVPYKVYAIEAGAGERSLAAFLLVSVPARLARFLISIAIVAVISRVATARRISATAQKCLLLGFWLIFYVFYLSRMPW